jgi:hypothetical protein
MGDRTYVTFAVREKDENHPAVKELLKHWSEETYVERGVLTLCRSDVNWGGEGEARELIDAGVFFVRHNDAGDNYGEGLMVHLGKERIYECATLDHEPVTVVRALKDGSIQLPGLANGLKADAARKEFYDLCEEDYRGDDQD